MRDFQRLGIAVSACRPYFGFMTIELPRVTDESIVGKQIAPQRQHVSDNRIGIGLQLQEPFRVEATQGAELIYANPV